MRILGAVTAALALAETAHAAPATPIRYCTDIASDQGRQVAAIIVEARTSQARLIYDCSELTLYLNAAEWTTGPGVYLPHGWKIGRVYRNNRQGEVIVELAAPPSRVRAFAAEVGRVLSPTSGWRRVG